MLLVCFCPLTGSDNSIGFTYAPVKNFRFVPGRVPLYVLVSLRANFVGANRTRVIRRRRLRNKCTCQDADNRQPYKMRLLVVC